MARRCFHCGWYKKYIWQTSLAKNSIDDAATMNLQSAGKPIIRESEKKKELLVPIKFKNNSAVIKQIISWQ